MRKPEPTSADSVCLTAQDLCLLLRDLPTDLPVHGVNMRAERGDVAVNVGPCPDHPDGCVGILVDTTRSDAKFH